MEYCAAAQEHAVLPVAHVALVLRSITCRAAACALLALGLYAYRPIPAGASSVPLFVQANGAVAEQGDQESILVTAAPDITISLTLSTSATYPSTATLFGSFDTMAAVSVASIAGNGTESFSFQAGPDGRAILTFPIPPDAPPGLASVQASDDNGSTALAGFTVVAPISGTFTGSVFVAMPHVLIRTPELPPLGGSVVHERIRIITSPGATVVTGAVISGTAAALGTASDGGTAHASGTQFFTDTQTADGDGSVLVRVPLGADLLRPGYGARVLLRVDSTSGAITTEYRTSLSLRESRLRLLAVATSTTRGGQRRVFQLGHQSAGYSTLHVLVIANPGAHITAQVLFASSPAISVAATIGPGSRALLAFKVPNAYAPPAGIGAAIVSVSSSFRGASVTRTISFTYRRR